MQCIKILANIAKFNSRKSTNKLVNIKKLYQVQPAVLFSSFNSEDDELSEDIVNKVCGEDKDLEKKLRILMLEVQVMREDGRKAPNHLELRHWKELVLLKSKSQRISYLQFLFKREKSKENEKAKKLARAAERELFKDDQELKEFPDDLMYGIKNHSFLLRVRSHSIDNFYNYRMIQSMLYGQKLVLDCSYEDNMVYRENKNAAKQVTALFGDNRIHRNPFNIFMCGVNNNGSLMECMRRNIPCVDDNWFPMNIHTESYLDLFPKEKLVYLTPDARADLTEFDHDAIYIIGCLVDKVNNEPLSLAKAKKEGLKMARLPLEKHVEWGKGSKTLNVNHMLSILLDLKATGDWTFALRHLPRRKLMEFQMKNMQTNPNILNKIRKNNFASNKHVKYVQKQHHKNKGSIEISKYF